MTQLTLLYLVSRYVHIVCTTMLVGGTLFYEMVVPAAIDELRHEQKLLVFARARWVFKGIVWSSVILIILSGAVSTWMHWPQYTASRYVTPDINGPTAAIPPAGQPGWWWAAHATGGFISALIALSLIIGDVPPSQPVRWMRLNLVILLLVIFLATATRQARIENESAPATPSKTSVNLHDS
jgi:hypothetical protein